MSPRPALGPVWYVHRLSALIGAATLALAAAGPGRADAVGFGGQADFTIDVPGYHGLEPELHLTHDNRAGNGWIGAGWSLAGLSEIERVGPGRGAPTYGAKDRFLLDGLELVPCTANSASPGCRHPSGEGSATRRGYATRIERFQRIEFEPSSQGGFWTTWATDGIKRVYRPRVAVGWRRPEEPFSWHLASVEDPLGNRVSYNYGASGEADGIGQQYLTRILYTGTLITFHTESRPDVVTSATGRGLVITRRRLARIDVATGSELVRTYKLEYQSPEPTGSGHSLLRSVRQFGSDARLGAGGAVTGGTALPPVTLGTATPGAGSVGSFESETDPVALWAPPWPNSGFGHRNWDNETADPYFARFAHQYGRQWFPGDTDGDGRTDYIGVTFERSPPGPSGPFWINLHTAMPNRDGTRNPARPGTGQFNYRYTDQATGILWYNDNPGIRYFRAFGGDVNADGRTDVVIVRLQSRPALPRVVWIHTALSLGDGKFEMPPPQRVNDNWDPRVRWFVADADGDGRADLLRVLHHGACDTATAALTGCTPGRTFEHAALHVSLSNGDGTWRFTDAQETDWTFLEGDDAHWFVGDANADGRADFQRVVNLAPHDALKTSHAAIQTAFSRGDGKFDIPPIPAGCPGNPRPLWCASGIAEIDAPWRSWDNILPWLDQQTGSDLAQAGDFDGDGRSDIALASIDPETRRFVRLVTAFSKGDGTYRTVGERTTLPAEHLNLWWKIVRHEDHFPNRWVTGDWNGDGATDLVVASPDDFDAGPAQWPRTVALTRLLSDRNGKYTVERPRPTPFYFECWERVNIDPTRPPQCPNDLSFTAFLGDVDGDGQDDFMYAGGRFTEALQRTHFQVKLAPIAHEGTHRWRSGDVDGDGREDLVYPQYTNAGVTVHTLLRRRDGSWDHKSEPVMPFMYNPVARDWVVADVGSADGGPDGRADLVYKHYYDDAGTGLRLYTLLSQGDGTWVLRYRNAEWPDFGVRDTGNWRPTDVDADGDTDLVHVFSTGLTDLVKPDRAIRVHTMRSNGDGSWTPIAKDPWSGFGTADTANWKPLDVNGDGRGDLVHLDGTRRRVLVRTLLSNGDGTWERRFDVPVTGVDASDTRGWRPADVNADGGTDLVHLALDGGDLQALVLLSNGDGQFTARSGMAWPGFRRADTRRWHAADVNADGATDLVHVESLTPGVRLRTLMARPDGSFAPRPPDGDTDTWPGLDAPDVLNWQPADTGGDGRDDLVRVEYERPRLHVRILHSTAPMDLLTTTDNGLGNRTEVTYKPSSAFGPRKRPATGMAGCNLPHGVVLQLPALVVKRTEGVQADRQTNDYACARWSYSERGLLGWAQTTTEHAATFNRPAAVTVERHRLDDKCLSRPIEARLQDVAGRLLTRSVSEYPAVATRGPPICLPERIRVWAYNGGLVGQETQTAMSYDPYGNLDRVEALGNPTDPVDDQVVRRRFKPATGPWIVALPASEELRDGTETTARRYRRTAWCYDGNNGTPHGNCPGVPAKGLLTAAKALHDDGRYRTTRFGHDAVGNQTTVTDPRGNTTTVSYDPIRRIFPEAVCNARKQCTTTEWNRNQGQVRAVIDPNGGRTKMTHDPLGRLQTMRLPGRGVVTYSYLDWDHPSRRRVRETADDGTPDGLWSETWLDGLDRAHMLVKEGDQRGRTYIQHIVYSDASAQPAAGSNWATQPAGDAPVFERFEYDALGRLVTQTHADGTKRGWDYGNDTKRTWATETDERGNTSTEFSDAQGRLAGVEASDGHRVSRLTYSYDAANQVRTVTDDLGNVTTRAYDLLGNLQSTDDPDLGRWTWTWDQAGNLKTRTDARGRRITYTYDQLNRPRTKRYRNGTKVVWRYDEPGHGAGTGRLTSVTDPTGAGCQSQRSRQLTYDASGQVRKDTRCVDGNEQPMRFEFDRLGRQKTVIYPDGERQAYGYDSAGRLRDMPGLIGEFNYDAEGHMTKAERADSTRTVWTWDPKRRWLDEITTASPVTGSLLKLSYTHYPDGLVKTATASPAGPNLSYTYDGLDRVTHVTGDIRQRFKWNSIGNLKKSSGVTYAYPASGPAGCIRNVQAVPCRRPHAASRIGKQTYDYDANGNTIAVRSSKWYVVRAKQPGRRRDTLWAIAADHLGDSRRWPEIFALNKGRRYPKPRGGRFRDPHWIYPSQRLLMPADATGTPAATAPGSSAKAGFRRLRWDADNRLAWIQNRRREWTRMRYDAADDRVEKRRGNHVTHYFGRWLEDTFPRPGTTKYYWAGPTLIARRDRRGLHFYHQDHLGSTRLLTGGEGRVKARYSFQPFGAPHQHSGSSSTDRQFTGERHDKRSGLVHMGARYYDPARARFVAADTISPQPGVTQAANRYAYAYGNPLGWTDPTGRQPECAVCESEEDGGPGEGEYPHLTEWAWWPYEEVIEVWGMSEPPLIDAPPSVFSGEYWGDVWDGLTWYAHDLHRQQTAYDKTYERTYAEEKARISILEQMFARGVTDDPVHRRVVRRIGERPPNIFASLAETAIASLLVTRVGAPGRAGAPAPATAGAPPPSGVRVGRWMSKTEYDKMVASGRVQESYTGTTHVASPANPHAFGQQAPKGSVYVEFDVPAGSVAPGGQPGWGRILGPNSMEGRNAALRGRPVPEMPPAENIKIGSQK